ncbi:MAG: hypothetical protein CMP71_02205 [Flavobacteriales bacterium]|nr:hypothetical protein [Flavobacteriales bacterium]|tara:strand:+ start:1907 stop:2644 length:738 start_codon:yes stop_codon:yes gene_type:complete
MKKEFLLLLAIFFSFFIKAEDNLFKKGTEFYDSGNYQMAIAYFDSLTSSGTISSEVHYNKGNCYFKLDSLALAIVEYERGIKINPKDLDIVYNLKICKDLIIDDINQLPEIFYKQWFSSLINTISIYNWQILIFISLILLIISLIVTKIKTNNNLKIFNTFLSIIISISLTIYFIGNFSEKNNIQAIVKENVVNIRSAPSDESSVQFTVHSGTKVVIIDAVENWFNISISDGRKGWAHKTSVIEI